jgi:hypothetical protein
MDHPPDRRADTGAGHDTIIGPNSPAQTAGRNGRDNRHTLRSLRTHTFFSAICIAAAVAFYLKE